MNPLAADKEVERAITACCRPKCYPDVNASIVLLGTALGSDPSNGRERVLFAGLQRTVDVALKSYRSELIARRHAYSKGAPRISRPISAALGELTPNYAS